MSEPVPELWINEDGRIACDLVDCIVEDGYTFFGRSEQTGSIITRVEGSNQGHLYEKLNSAAIVELGVLLVATKHFTLQCAGGHVGYDASKRELVLLVQPDSTTAGTSQ